MRNLSHALAQIAEQSDETMRILVIEDEDIVRRPLCRYLRCRGFEVMEASDGREGLLRVESGAPELVITDIVMPETAGLDLILSLRQSHPDLPIIAVSGGLIGSETDVLHVAQEMGAAAVLPKPFSLPQLLTVIDQVVTRADPTAAASGEPDADEQNDPPATATPTTGPSSASTPRALLEATRLPSVEAPPRSDPGNGRTPFARLEAVD